MFVCCCFFYQESNLKKQRLVDAAESRGLMNHYPLQPVPPTGVVTAPYPTTPNHHSAPQCGPMTKEQIEQVMLTVLSEGAQLCYGDIVVFVSGKLRMDTDVCYTVAM